jgi:DNA-binding XRE family transcriptional regulator
LACDLRYSERKIGDIGFENCAPRGGVPMNVQVIEREGRPEWAILPYDEFLQLVEKAEMLQDINDYDQIIKAVEEGTEETVPAELAYILMEGENPIKAWREYRRLTQKQLADTVGISNPFLSQVEAGKRKASTKIMLRLAKALQVTLDDLVTE